MPESWEKDSRPKGKFDLLVQISFFKLYQGKYIKYFELYAFCISFISEYSG